MNVQLMNRCVDWGIANARIVYGLLILVVISALTALPSIQIDTDPENMLASTNAERVFHNQVKRDFAMHDMLVVGITNTQDPAGIYALNTLAGLHAVTQQVIQLDGVIAQDAMALSVVDNIKQGAPGEIRFEWMMNAVPTQRAEAEQIAHSVQRLPMLHNTLVSADNKAAAIYLPIAHKDQSFVIAQQVREIIDGWQANHPNHHTEWHITGLPVAEDQFGHEMFVQMAISAPLAGLTIFLLLFYFFRQIQLIIAPMIVAMVTVIVTMGLLIGFGFEVHILSSMIAIFLMPIAVVDSVHVLSEFADRITPQRSVNEVIKDVMSELFQPMLFTSLTSAVGFFSLLVTPIPPVQIFGAFIGFGILFAFMMTMLFIPVYISRMSSTSIERLIAKHHDGEVSPLIAKVSVLGRFSLRFSSLILGVSALILVVSVWGISKINVNDNPVRWFKSDHEIRIADRVLNTHFAGTYDAFLVLDSTLGNAQQSIREVTVELLKEPSVGAPTKQQIIDNVMPLLAVDDALTEITLVADDVLFSASDSEMPALDAWMASIERIQAEQKRFLQPDVLLYMQALNQQLVNSGLVGKSNSLIEVISTVNRELHSGTDADYHLPSSANAVAQVLLQYQSSHRPQDLWHFVRQDYRQSLMWLQLTSGDNQDMTKVVQLVADYIQQHPLPEGIQVRWAGKAYLNLVWQENMVEGMLDSLLSAFVIVLLMMVILFRSVIFGVLAMLPLTLTICFIYGAIGWVGKDYDMPIAVLSALTLGLSVDFAIHFLERSRAAYAETKDFQGAMRIMFDEPARAISRNALVIALGFTPLLFAPLVPYITVGVFLGAIMFISALVTLLLLPPCLQVLRRVLFSSPESTNVGENNERHA